MIDVLLTVVLACVFSGIAYAYGSRRFDERIGRLLAWGVVARVLGSTARFEVMERFYNGVGDAKHYFGMGIINAAAIHAGEFSFLDVPAYRGTIFVQWMTGFVVAIVGENIRACFFLFSMFGFIGLVLIGRAIEEAFGRQAHRSVLAWFLLWPSLFYWPASIGKDTVMLLALGLFVFGFVGRKGAPRWPPLIAGVVLAAAVRPHIAAAFAASGGLADLVSRASRERPAWARRTQLLVVVGVAALTAYQSSVMLVGEFDLEGLQEEYEFRSGQTHKGGSQIGASSGLAAIPMAYVNILMRPFPWEAGHALALLSSLEIWSIWVVAWMNRRVALRILKRVRESRLVGVAIPLVLLITLMYGVTFFNLGIIARQRVVVLPLLLLLPALARSTDGADLAQEAGRPLRPGGLGAG